MEVRREGNTEPSLPKRALSVEGGGEDSNVRQLSPQAIALQRPKVMKSFSPTDSIITQYPSPVLMLIEQISEL